MRKNKTSYLKSLDKKYLWHPFTQMKDWLADDQQPLVIDRAQGVYLIDTDGNQYIDGVSSLWVNVHGHGHPKIDAAIKRQVDSLSHSTILGLANTPSVELAERLVSIAPKGLKKVFYSDNGSTSVEIALKMAYQYWQNNGKPTKRTLVHLQNSYHGDISQNGCN
ncbi:MAG: aminotransferase class III-fold pyridoxal phosphate-dependent enzyme [Candidatus Omnitrophota bacterium]